MVINLKVNSGEPRPIIVAEIPEEGQFIFPYRNGEKDEYGPTPDASHRWGYLVVGVRPPLAKDDLYLVGVIRRPV